MQLLLVLWQANDIAFTDGTLLEVDEPLFKAVDMQDVLAHGDLHQLLLLLEVLQAQTALPLICHVGIVDSIFYVL